MEETQDLAATIKKIDAIVREHEIAQNIMRCYDLDDRVKEALRHYQDTATQQLAGSKNFRDDMVVWLRALSMLTESAISGATHTEKNTRLRGMLELIEGAVSKLREQQFDFSHRWWQMPDVFRSDYPTRQYVERIHELEAEILKLKTPQE